MDLPEYAEFPAPPPLDALIHCFWFLRGSIGGTEAQPVLPDGRVEIVLHLGEPFAEVDAHGVARGQAEALLAGQLTAPIQLVSRGNAEVIGIRFRSASARSVLGFPASEVTGRVEPLFGLRPGLAGALLTAAHRRNDAKTPRRNGDIVEDLAEVLRRWVRQVPSPEIVEAVRTLDRVWPVPVRELAGRLGVSMRTLERRMIDEVGLPPRMLGRVFRFRRALRMLEDAPRGTWSRAAIRAGYFDQPHLIRDFKRFAGVAPAEFFRTDAPLSRAIQGYDGER